MIEEFEKLMDYMRFERYGEPSRIVIYKKQLKKNKVFYVGLRNDGVFEIVTENYNVYRTILSKQLFSIYEIYKILKQHNIKR